MKLIYGELEKKKDIVLKKVVIEYDQQGIKQNFLYMLNCIKHYLLLIPHMSLLFVTIIM